MQLFSIHKHELTPLDDAPFKLEKDIQNLFEQNLVNIANLQWVKSEFIIKQFRIDTLAFDPETNAFVIIEYKRERNFSVVDQGVSYLNLMLEYKADFLLEYNESQKIHLKRDQIDWAQSRIVFVAPSFTDYQKQAANFKDLPIELWEVKRFKGDILLINPIKKSKSAPKLKEVQVANFITKQDKKSLPESEVARLAQAFTVYSENDHLQGKSAEVIELYEDFKHAILMLAPDLDIVPRKLYLAFKLGKNVALSIHLQHKGLKMWFSPKNGVLDDAKCLSKDVKNIGHWGVGDYEISVQNTNNLEYIMSLIKQAL